MSCRSFPDRPPRTDPRRFIPYYRTWNTLTVLRCILHNARLHNARTTTVAIRRVPVDNNDKLSDVGCARHIFPVRIRVGNLSIAFVSFAKYLSHFRVRFSNGPECRIVCRFAARRRDEQTTVTECVRGGDTTTAAFPVRPKTRHRSCFVRRTRHLLTGGRWSKNKNSSDYKRSYDGFPNWFFH